MDEPPLILRLFLGSPGGVAAEREVVRQVVQRLNKLVAPRLGYTIVLYMWEDDAPAYGRPQSLINRNLEECDIFVGILYRRWGIATGEYSSGFEEEFEHAIARRRSTSSPEVVLFFKDVDAESLEDPGPQLQRVLRFRSEIERTGEVLYRTFSEMDEWKDVFTDAILAHVATNRILGSKHQGSGAVGDVTDLIGIVSRATDLSGVSDSIANGSGELRSEAADDQPLDPVLPDLIRRTISLLPDKVRTVLLLHYIADMSMEEVARVVGITTSAAVQLEEGGLRTLRDAIDAAGSGS